MGIFDFFKEQNKSNNKATLISDNFESAKLLQENENHDEAIKLLNEIIKIDPNQEEAYASMAFSKLAIKDDVGALKDAYKAIEIDPNSRAGAIIELLKAVLEEHETEEFKKSIEKYKEQLEKIWDRIEEKNSGKDKPDGDFKDYYKTGILKEEGVYENKIREGVWKFYYSSGKIATQCCFKNDLKEGEYLEYYNNGQISTKEVFINDELHGNAKMWYENGVLKASLQFEKGELIKGDMFNELGEIIK